MKKQNATSGRKLVLNRETLDLLDQEAMGRIAGGYSDVSLCYPDQTFGCPSTVHTRPACA